MAVVATRFFVKKRKELLEKEVEEALLLKIREAYMIEDRLLTQTYTIPNHPVSGFEVPLRRKYVMALGEFLCFITQANQNAKIIYGIWAESIYTNISGNWIFTPDFIYLKEGLFVNRDDTKCNIIRLSLLFDCFYLAEKVNSDFLEKSYIFLHRKINGYFTEETLKYVYNFFLGLDLGDKIPVVLRNHRRFDLEFQRKPLKKVLVVATMTAGKSTLINALTGKKINKVASTVCTNKIRFVHNKQANEGTLLECSGQRYIYTENHKIAQHDSVKNVGVHFQSILSQERICLIDTPGVNYSGDHSHGRMTRDAVDANDYNLLLFVSDATQFMTNDDARILEYVIKNCKKKIVFCLNKCDCFDPDDDSINETLTVWREILAKYKIQNPQIVTISALGALLLKLEKQAVQLTKSEQIQLKSIRRDLSDSFYYLEQYCTNRVNNVGTEDFLIHTGILNLEVLLYENDKH